MARRGQPRAAGPSVSGLSTEQEILHAAACLFCTEGYGSVSTYKIAAAARVSQATMYHYFSGKHAILLTLLLDTVKPSVGFAESLVDRTESPEARLWALCAFDTTLLVSGDENLGSLYLLPELGDERFESFHVERTRLRSVYNALVTQCPDVTAPMAADLSDLVFGLVESAILRRRLDNAVDAAFAARTADAALRVIGVGAVAAVEAARAGHAILTDG
ncbi:TetR/AcrR family transcriptional regulator [Rhodococcus rhodnii]|uniref:MalT family transcriptional regulator n=2 Tax=Rhodococcus rhodnii TaxID=38312 RepID=R7WMU4_9NOCA|nr:TetR/AcrR family transcriptional regulator [Rhodococcus rhodnii]EOM76627.1 MalT family transcriptional regulator [Rhodococcus rhodnii LMG 5362]TXG89502.1 TetR/AcrR family transcriptional regulator [Rhodococcus rhodnii]